jgi:glycerol kinase
VVRPRVTETTALGAAYLAGLATGVWRDTDEIAALWQVDRVFEPGWSADRRLAKRQRWLQAVERAGHWAQD